MYHDLAGAISYRLYFHESSPLEIVLADMCQPLSGERGLPHSGGTGPQDNALRRRITPQRYFSKNTLDEARLPANSQPGTFSV